MTRFIFDARALAEPYPTGVTIVARQFLERLNERVPELSVLTATHTRTNAITNLGYSLRLHSIEDVLSTPREPRALFFSPNLNFSHTRRGTRRIAVAHDLSFLHSPYWFNFRSRLWHVAVRAREQLRRADMIVAVSAWTAADIQNTLGVPQEKIHIIHLHTPLVVAPEAPHLPFTNAPFFLFLGTLEGRKNINSVIEAFTIARTLPALAEYHLILAGRVGHGAPLLSALPPRVHHFQYPTDAQKWWLLKHAAALVYPSFFEGFGLPPLEAAAAGCPVITSNVTALPETMCDGALAVSPYDISQIVIALEAIVVDVRLRAQCVERARARAAWYSIERQGAAFDSLLRRVEHLL